MKFLLVLVVLAGCLPSYGYGWTESPQAVVRPEISALHADNPWVDNAGYWRAEVAEAVGAWNAALAEFGCTPPFAISIDDDATAYPVRLIPASQWPHERERVGDMHGGSPEVGFIDIREWRPTHSNLPTLVHELGHALGLSHRADPMSVMTSEVGTLVVPSYVDSGMVAELRGCQP